MCQIILCRSLLILSTLFTCSGNVDLNTPFGGAGINANVGLPESGSSLLTTAVIGLGVLSLINTITQVAIPWITGKEDESEVTTKKPDEADSDGKFRTMRNLFPQKTLDTLENAVVETLLKAKDKYL